MNPARYSATCCSVLVLCCLAGCSFAGGATTFRQQHSPVGTGFITATEENGGWGLDGPPPQVGDVIERPVYRYFVKSRSFWLFSSEQGYRLSDPYPSRRYTVTAIQEVETETRREAIMHYYQVSVDPA